MPVECTKRGNKYRVVEANTNNIAKNKNGTPVDGGGHNTPGQCRQQAKAINANTQNS